MSIATRYPLLSLGISAMESVKSRCCAVVYCAQSLMPLNSVKFEMCNTFMFFLWFQPTFTPVAVLFLQPVGFFYHCGPKSWQQCKDCALWGFSQLAVMPNLPPLPNPYLPHCLPPVPQDRTYSSRMPHGVAVASCVLRVTLASTPHPPHSSPVWHQTMLSAAKLHIDSWCLCAEFFN